ncbi:MAG: sigma 54-dependent Fis family transcriptional regulator [Deltaproteobacteria bacterium]|nr:sigma 54-dependent Fis family transcriptional regulator [Deltaproteobacteria bacterium]
MTRPMDAIVLSFRGEPLRVFPVGQRPLEVGSGPSCDVVVHDAAVPSRAWLVHEGLDGAPVARDLVNDGPLLRLVPGVELPLGERYAIARAPALDPPRSRELSLATEQIVIGLDEGEKLTLVIGRGRDARRVRLEGTPLTLGSAPSCDVVLSDRAVSAVHCRLEPDRQSAWVRDLGSRNGTWVDNVRTGLGRIAPGSRMRVGRTEIFVVDQGARGDARADGLVASSWQMIEILGRVEALSRSMAPVLVWGPSGAGKEGIARALHTRGPRAREPFVAVNAAAIPRDLVESELFGHEKGAFTGADASRRGVFEQADRGTLFLDEIGELSMSIQARLLRVLDNWSVKRVGGETERRVDVRLVCATHRDLRSLVARGGFRSDLYYRLVHARIDVPPLSDRPEDVRALAAHFLEQARPHLGARTLSQEAIECLVSYGWPGNVRELRSVVLGAATSSSGIVHKEDVRTAIAEISGAEALSDVSPLGARLLVQQHGSVSAAARAIGVARSTLRDRLARSGPVPDGRTRALRTATG